ncbi:hypothetical protein QFC21_003082 [Naganishia friedmannii]|uniref:Uncharacterized protein n=1 Tax=Naganishia friedmannii TaxID=89922 RepID=A0ACC2VRE2_9TREE|nr:hypothetical protein QFC21_003082 [Naganishia friedmannii]
MYIALTHCIGLLNLLTDEVSEGVWKEIEYFINIHRDFDDAVRSNHLAEAANTASKDDNLEHENDSSVEIGRHAMSAPRLAGGENVLQESNAANFNNPDTTVDGDSSDADENWVAAKPAAKNVIGRRKKDTNTVKKAANMSRIATKNQQATPPKCISIASSESVTERKVPRAEVALSSTRCTSTSRRSSIESYQLSEQLADSTILHDAEASFHPQRRAEHQRRLRRRVVSSSEGSSSGVDIDQQEDEVLASLAKLSVESVPKESHLADALQLCDQSIPHDFATFIDTHRIASTSATAKSGKKHGAQISQGSNRFEKLGEATYSEVFGVYSTSSSSTLKGPEAVMKVIPLALMPSDKPSRRSTNSDASQDNCELMCVTEMQEIVKEIELTRLMNGVHDGFVNLRGAHIVQGVYPDVLLECWDTYDKTKGSDNTRPDCLPQDQYYAILFLDNAGTDLESYRFGKACGWRQAVDVLWQIADALSAAEEKADFEHRDLHEGQVLVSTAALGELQTTIIDFGLSRARVPGREDPIWSAIPDDVFDGQGEQWDVYRAMRSHIEALGGEWDQFYPTTNIMWLHYLTRRLLYATSSLTKPRSKVLSRVMSRRDPTRSPIRRRVTRNGATTTLMTPSINSGLDSSAELEAWEKLKQFEEGLKAGLTHQTDDVQKRGARALKSGILAKMRDQKPRTGGNRKQGIHSVGDALLWFVAHE